jgi:hypothetical protein
MTSGRTLCWMARQNPTTANVTRAAGQGLEQAAQ